MSGSKSSLPGMVAPKQKIEMYSNSYFGACLVGGIVGSSSGHLETPREAL